MSKVRGEQGLALRPSGYAEWLAELKQRVHVAQQRAALSVNREVLQLYWQIGRDIRDRQALAGWGAGIVDQLAADLRVAFPEMKGFPARISCTCGHLPKPGPRSTQLANKLLDNCPGVTTWCLCGD